MIDEQKPIDATALVGIVIAAKKGRFTEAEFLVVIMPLMHETCNTIELSTKKKQPKAATIRTSLNLQVSGQTLAELQEIYDEVLVQMGSGASLRVCLKMVHSWAMKY